MNYLEGTEICLHDLIEHAQAPGRIIATAGSAGGQVVADGFEWTVEAGDGIWLLFVNGAIARIGEPDEDLVFLSRAEALGDPAASTA